MIFKKSLFRAKSYLYLFCLFFVHFCLDVDESNILLSFLVVGAAIIFVFLFFFNKCEVCGYRAYTPKMFDFSSENLKKAFTIFVDLKFYFPPKKCPKCNVERV